MEHTSRDVPSRGLVLTWPFSEDLDDERAGYHDDGKVDAEVHATVGDSGAGLGQITSLSHYGCSCYYVFEFHRTALLPVCLVCIAVDPLIGPGNLDEYTIVSYREH